MVPALPSKLYNWIKYLVLIALPAFATAYNALGDGLDLPAVAKVTLVCAVAATFLGTLVGLSSTTYNRGGGFDGELEVNAHDPSLVHSLNLDGIEPKRLGTVKTVTLKVIKNNAEPPAPDLD